MIAKPYRIRHTGLVLYLTKVHESAVFYIYFLTRLYDSATLSVGWNEWRTEESCPPPQWRVIFLGRRCAAVSLSSSVSVTVSLLVGGVVPVWAHRCLGYVCPINEACRVGVAKRAVESNFEGRMA